MTTRLFHISDVHFGVENSAALQKVVQAVEEDRPDALICTGDLTQRATQEQYRAAADWFGQFEIPVWLDPGNHDMPYYNLWERFTDPYRRYDRLRADVAVPHFESDDCVLVPLRTTVPAQRRWPWSDGVVKPKALEAALERLANLRGDSRSIIVTAHHPLHGPKIEGPNATIGGDDALDALVSSGMDAIMTGHIHTPFNKTRNTRSGSAQVIGAGTLSKRLRHGAPNSYNVLTIDAAKGQSCEIAVETRVLS